MAKLTIKKVRDNLKGSRGIMATVAKRCKVNRCSLFEFLEKNPELKKELEKQKEKDVMVVEDRLYEFATKGSPNVPSTFNSVKMILSKEKGYGDKLDINQKTNITGEVDLSIIDLCKDYEQSTDSRKSNKKSKKK